MYSVCVVETVTGKYLGPLNCSIDSWARELNGTDTATVTLSPGALTVANRDWLRLITTPRRSSLMISWEGVPIFCGPIILRPFDGLQVKINATGVRTGIFGSRKAHTWTAPYATQVISYTNVSLGTIAQNLAQLGTSGTKPGSSIPIVYPSTEADTDPTHVRTYNGYELKYIADLWTELTGVINGPDIDFQPVWTDATQTLQQYIMRIGTLASPKIGSASQLSFNYSQPKSSVKSLSYVEDGSQLVTADWAAGSGTAATTLMSFTSSTALTAQGWPLLEGETDYRTVLDQATLDTYSAGDLQANATVTAQFGLTIDALQPPAFGSYQLGDQAVVTVRNHIWIPDGDYSMRIVRMSGDNTTSIQLGMQAA